MPQMKMNRNWVVATKRGHTVRFEKGVPVGVPDDTTVVEACLAAGAEYVNPNQAPVLPDMSQPVAPAALTAAQRRDKVFAVFREMVANQAQHRDNFTAYGRPSAKYITSAVGFDVPAKDVEAHWAAFQSQQ
jgi:hypothetical protein